MKMTENTKIQDVLASYRTKRQLYASFAFVAVLVMSVVAFALHQQGIAATHTEQVLDCHYSASGTVAHTHNADCYDAEGNLVCPLPEVEYHVHDDSCYVETRELACGMEEHVHDDSCYDGEGNITCGMEEHAHDDSCYAVTRELACGKEEVAEEHVHGPGCFRTITVDDGEGDAAADDDPEAASDVPAEALTADEAPAQTFTQSFKDSDERLGLRVDVDAPEGALPAGTTMDANWVSHDDLTKEQEEALRKALDSKDYGAILELQAVDVTFFDGGGAEVEPASDVTVTLTSALADTDDEAVIARVEDEAEARERARRVGAKTAKVEAKAIKALSDKQLRNRKMSLSDDQVAFDADRGTTYVLARTSVAQSLEASDGDTYVVTVDAPAEAGVPAESQLQVSEVWTEVNDHTAREADALKALDVSAAKSSRFLALTLEDSKGNEVKPVKPFKVTIEIADTPKAASLNVVRFDNTNANPQMISIEREGATATFESKSLGVFGMVYTAKKLATVEGDTYSLSLPKGGVVSLLGLVEELGIGFEDVEEVSLASIEELVLSSDGADEDARLFVESIEKIEPSDPDTIWVGKTEANTTVGSLKEDQGLETTFTASLTPEQVTEVEKQAIEKDDWILVARKPFESNQELTVTLYDGQTFTVVVSDPQSKRTTLSATGTTYVVTVTYGADAQIPDGAVLQVDEIAEEEQAYSDIQAQIEKGLNEGRETIPSHPTLLNISIMFDGKEIEPAEGSEVSVEVKLAVNAAKGMYTDEDSPLLINNAPVTEDQADMEKQIQVLHLEEQDQVNVMETTDTISTAEVSSEFTTDSFSDWLVYLDEDLTDIDVTTSDSLTLRPYTEWVWKKSDEPQEYQGVEWYFPDDEWTQVQSQGITTYTHKTNGSVFEKYSKTDDQLNETYTVVRTRTLKEGTFTIQNGKNNIAKKTINVTVTQGSSSGKPDTVAGIPGIKVNLFDYDVPTTNGQYDFTKSGNLDSSGNTASSPVNETVNIDHDLKFLGWGASNVANTNNWFTINNYSKDNPNQGIVKTDLGADGAPELSPGLDGRERGNPSLGYLFDTNSHTSSVYAFADAGGLFQQDNLGYYYYNSNVNYAEYDRDNNQFVLYEHTYTQNTGKSNGANAKPIGFFPFHEYDTGNQQQTMNHNKDLNHHFGMSMAVDFEIPKDRKASAPDGYKHDIIYEFSGDDDLWVFVDDKLVLDIGGIHQPVTGQINFTTGVITVHGEKDKTMTFDVGSHTLKMFYIERGGCDSNLSVKFNLPLTIGKGNVRIAKKSATDDASNADTYLPGAVFGIWDNENCEGDPYTIATSDKNGIVFKNLPIRNEGQKYYLQEITPPEGYLLDKTIYTLTAAGKDEHGEYIFTIANGDTTISETDSTFHYPIVRNKLIAPISVTVKKSWQNADGSTMNPVPDDLSAKFKLKRYMTYSTTPVFTVKLVSDDQSIGVFDSIVATEGDVLTIRYRHAPDANGTTVHCSTKNGVSNVLTLTTNDSGSSTEVSYTVNASHASDGIIEIIVPKSFTDLCNGAQYSAGQNPTFVDLHMGDHNTVREIDSSFEQEVTLTKQNNWARTLSDLAIQEKKNGIVYHYEYYFEEKDIPAGYEAVYLDSDGNPVSDSSSQATNTTGTQAVVNRQLLDVPVEKKWADLGGETYSWTVVFQLEEMEVKVNKDDPDAADAVTEFTPVEGKTLTLTDGQSPLPVFTNLPMYRVHSNGTVYRLQYSVGEVSYKVLHNGTVVAQWSKDGSLETIGDTRYVPQFIQDAGENGSSIEDYQVIVVNVMENRKLSKDIELDVHKTWPDDSEYASADDTYAHFKLKRYVHQEYRDYSNTSIDTEWVTITLDTWGNGTKQQTVTVPKNTEVHIVGNIKGATNANKIRFTQSSGQADLELVKDNTQSDSQIPFDIKVVADQTKTITLAQGDNYVAGGRDGFRLSDTYGNKTADALDESFEEEFTLNKANGWSKSFDYLPVVEEQDIDSTTGPQTIYVFSYFLEETSCNPDDFYPVLSDAAGVARGDEDNRIDTDTALAIENQQSTIEVTFKKVDKESVNKQALTDDDLLKGAAFTLTKYPNKGAQGKDTTWGDNGSITLSDDKEGNDYTLNGVFTFDGLTKGYYVVDEIAFPDGYIKLSDAPSFEVKVNASTGELEIVLDNDCNGLVRLVDGEFTLVIGNEPGIELPNAGGPGTTLGMLIGAALIVLGALVLVRRHRAGETYL